jgi:hypothetical protein
MTVPSNQSQSIGAHAMPSLTTSAASAYSDGAAADAVASLIGDLRRELGAQEAAVVVYFASSQYDPGDLAGPLAAAFPHAAVIGCSTAGEFTNEYSGVGGVSAIALPEALVARHAASLVDLSGDPAAAIVDAARAIEAQLGDELRQLDPSRHLGLVLIDGMHGAEEAVNEALGNVAPLLDVVGGSAGDDLAFHETWVAVGDEVSHRGAALIVCETTGPFAVVKTCTFAPTGHTLRVTKADVETRVVHEFDGRPAAVAYAEAIGRDPGALDNSAFMEHPVGLMVDGAPFIRSPQAVTDEGAIRFYCQILPGTEVEVMRGGDIIGETAAAVHSAVDDLGGCARGAVLFNCILRRLELDANDSTQRFVETFKEIPAAGFHTYGESWLGHINQTLTGVLFA